MAGQRCTALGISSSSTGSNVGPETVEEITQRRNLIATEMYFFCPFHVGARHAGKSEAHKSVDLVNSFAASHFSTEHKIHPIDTRGFSASFSRQQRGSPMSFVNRNWYLRGSSETVPPVPFTALDYVLCAVAFFLMGIAFNSDIATLVASVGK
jgi:hypothetical protein